MRNRAYNSETCGYEWDDECFVCGAPVHVITDEDGTAISTTPTDDERDRLRRYITAARSTLETHDPQLHAEIMADPMWQLSPPPREEGS